MIGAGTRFCGWFNTTWLTVRGRISNFIGSAVGVLMCIGYLRVRNLIDINARSGDPLRCPGRVE